MPINSLKNNPSLIPKIVSSSTFQLLDMRRHTTDTWVQFGNTLAVSSVIFVLEKSEWDNDNVREQHVIKSEI